MILSSVNAPVSSPAQTGSATDTGSKLLTSTQVANPVSKASDNNEDNHQTALQLLNKTLSRAYEKNSSQHSSAAADYTSFEPLTAEKVASNILGFIERRLQLDAADGASTEQLQSRLDAGLAGFNKGFADATEQLKALSLMSPDVETDVGKTKDLVLKGIDQLRVKFITQDTNPTKTISSKPAAKLSVPDFLPASNSASSNYEYGRARDFSFQLKTREGDTVTVHASSSEGFSYSNSGEKGTQNSQTSYAANQAMSWDVQGNLSDDEVGAINDLLDNVNKLATQFFNGDLDTAFEQAKNLGYDDAQIGSFSLNLAQAEVQQVTQTYKTFEPIQDVPAAPLLSEQLLPLGNFIRDLFNSINLASLLPEPLKVITDAAKNITGNEDTDQGIRFQQFIEKIGNLWGNAATISGTKN